MKAVVQKIKLVLSLLSIYVLYFTGTPSNDKEGNPLRSDQLFSCISKQLNRGTFGNISSVLILINDKFIFEQYREDTAPDKIVPVHSVTKSIVSFLAGIAMDAGTIKRNEKIFELFPEYKHIPNLDYRWHKVTVDELLNMTAGFEWDEAIQSDSVNPLFLMSKSSDPLLFIFSKNFDRPDKNCFNYNSACVFLLSEIISRKSNMSIEAFAKKYLFNPLEIKKYAWDHFDNDCANASGGLHLSGRDMAKIGQLFLSEGKIKNKQIISRKWFVRMKNKPVAAAGYMDATHYTNLWWMCPVKYRLQNEITNDFIFLANGFGNNHIVIIPFIKTVIVLTGGTVSLNSSMHYFYTEIVRKVMKSIIENNTSE